MRWYNFDEVFLQLKLNCLLLTVILSDTIEYKYLYAYSLDFHFCIYALPIWFHFYLLSFLFMPYVAIESCVTNVVHVFAVILLSTLWTLAIFKVSSFKNLVSTSVTHLPPHAQQGNQHAGKPCSIWQEVNCCKVFKTLNPYFWFS